MKFKKDKFEENSKPETLPEKEKRLAREIEKLPADVMEIVNLMLVWRGLKPFTKLTYIYKTWCAGDPEPDLTTSRKHAHVLEFNQLLGFIGLAAVAKKEERKEPSFETLPDKTDVSLPGKEYREYCIAPSLETAEKLANGLLEETETELDETAKKEIQKVSPDLYVKMIKEIK
ncbi:MAG: hypothetical protein Q7S81_01970 [bacterium]|nr:hypothetical protein [bacterium]